MHDATLVPKRSYQHVRAVQRGGEGAPEKVQVRRPHPDLYNVGRFPPVVYLLKYALELSVRAQ